jgi:hypothetical protein
MSAAVGWSTIVEVSQPTLAVRNHTGATQIQIAKQVLDCYVGCTGSSCSKVMNVAATKAISATSKERGYHCVTQYMTHSRFLLQLQYHNDLDRQALS